VVDQINSKENPERLFFLVGITSILVKTWKCFKGPIRSPLLLYTLAAVYMTQIVNSDGN